MAVGADFGAVRQGIGNVGDQRAGFGVDFAALDAEPAVDAVGSVGHCHVNAMSRRHKQFGHE